MRDAHVDQELSEEKTTLSEVRSEPLGSAHPPGKPISSHVSPQKTTSSKKPAVHKARKSIAPEVSYASQRSKTGSLFEAFQNAAHAPVPMETDLKVGNCQEFKMPNSGGLIDLVRDEDGREELKRMEDQNQVEDAIEKWFPEADSHDKHVDLLLATSFLLHMNSTLCFLTMAFRMLSKAPWTARMATTHVRQAVLAARGSGWWVFDHTMLGIHLPEQNLNWQRPLTKDAINLKWRMTLRRPFSP